MMVTGTRIIGIGQPAAGDDGVGIAVAQALRNTDLPAGVEIHEIDDPVWLIKHLDRARRVILIDAVIGANRPGDIQCFTPGDLTTRTVTPLSSHGMGVVEAIGLIHTLEPAVLKNDIRIIGISIRPPPHCASGMTPPVAAAVPRAVNLVLDLVAGNKDLDLCPTYRL